MIQFDYSTLNLDKLRELPIIKSSQKFILNSAGCPSESVAPPGYPTYFVQELRTEAYRQPGCRSPQAVIGIDGNRHVVRAYSDCKYHVDQHGPVSGRVFESTAELVGGP